MPTKTFLNLPKEKRIRVLKSAKKEFSRVPLEKAVIANIAKDAGIPRGSFYQYFNDIDDLFVYLLEYMYGISKKKFVKYLSEANNDVYKALKIKFSNEIDKLADNEINRQFKINTIAMLFNEDINDRDKIIPVVLEKESQIDQEYFPVEVQKQEDFNKFADIVKMIGNMCIQKYLTKQVDEDEIKDYYNNCIDFVKMGFTSL